MHEIEFIVPLEQAQREGARLRKTSPSVFPGVPSAGDDVILTEGGGVTLKVKLVRWDSNGLVQLWMESLNTSDELGAAELLLEDGFTWAGQP